jgi:hypothetical protein
MGIAAKVIMNAIAVPSRILSISQLFEGKNRLK